MTDEELPSGWTAAPLGSLARYLNGRAFSSKTWSTTGRPIIRIQNLTGSGSSFNHFDGELAERHIIRRGDLLVSWAATLGVFVWDGPEAALNQHIFKVLPFINPSYLRYAMTAALDEMYRKTHGSGMVHITKGAFDAVVVPVAPEAEQQRIVDELERRLSHVDAAIAGLSAALRRLAGTRKAVLISAVNEPWPDDWKKVTVGRAGEARLGLQRSPSRHEGTNMKPYLKVANVFEDRIDLTTVMEMHFTPEEMGRYLLQDGDILLNEGQSPEFLGRPAIWRGQSPEMYFTNSLIRFRAFDDVLSEWALLVFRRHMHAGRFRRESRVTTNIAHLALGRLKTVEFPIPSLAQQKQIVVEVERRLSLINAAELTVAANLRKAGNLRRSLLAAAFTGKLTRQDPSDEPAEILLKRIEFQLDAGTAVSRTTGKPTAKKSKEPSA